MRVGTGLLFEVVQWPLTPPSDEVCSGNSVLVGCGEMLPALDGELEIFRAAPFPLIGQAYGMLESLID